MSALLYSAAESFSAAGLSVIPIGSLQTKAPATDLLPRHETTGTATWLPFQRRLPTGDELERWFAGSADTPGLAIVAGLVSGNLTIMDFDTKYSGQRVFEDFCALVEEVAPGLLGRLPRVKTPSGGWHLYFRSSRVGTPEKLAKGGDGKPWIETKAEGGYCLAPRSPGYTTVHGSLLDIPVITAQEWELLLNCARSFNAHEQPTGQHYRTSDQPGIVFNARMDLADMERWLHEAGWVTVAQRHDGTRLMRRPGKAHGISATLGQGGMRSFYVFSSSAAPFEENQGYSAFGVWTQLRHAGDYRASAKQLAADGFGAPRQQQRAAALPMAEAPREAPWTVKEAHRPVARFDPRWLCAPTLISLVARASAITDWPAEFLAAPLLSVLGACVGTSRALHLTSTWSERSSIWTGIIGPPGSGKTPAMHFILQPFQSMQRTLNERWKQEVAEYEQDLAYWEGQPKGSRGAKPDGPPAQRKLVASDATLEAIVDILDKNPRGILLERDELLGWLLSFNQYKKNGGADRQMWLSIWSGVDFTVDRKGDGYSAYIHNPFVGVTGGIQPDRLRALRDGAEDGLIDRFLFFYPVTAPQPIRDVQFPQEYLSAYRGLLERLLDMRPAETEDGRPAPQAIYRTPEAFDMFSARDWALKQHAGTIDLAAVRNAYFKMASHAARVAIVLHEAQLADGVDIHPNVMSAQTMDAAWSIVECAANHLERAMGDMTERPADARAHQAIAWITKQGGSCTVRDVVRANLCGIKTASEARSLFEDLADRHLGLLELRKNTGGETATFRIVETGESA